MKLREISTKLTTQPQSPAELKALQDYYTEIQDTVKGLIDDIIQIMFVREKALLDIGYSFTGYENSLFMTIFKWPKEVDETMAKSERIQNEEKHKREESLLARKTLFDKDLTEFEQNIHLLDSLQ